MTDQDFIDVLNFARAKGFVARMFHPLVLVVTTAEYAAVSRVLNPASGLKTEELLPSSTGPEPKES